MYSDFTLASAAVPATTGLRVLTGAALATPEQPPFVDVAQLHVKVEPPNPNAHVFVVNGAGTTDLGGTLVGNIVSASVTRLGTFFAAVPELPDGGGDPGDAPCAGCRLVAALGDVPGIFAVDEEFLFFVQGSPPNFYKVPLAGGQPTTLGYHGSPRDIVADGTDVYALACDGQWCNLARFDRNTGADQPVGGGRVFVGQSLALGGGKAYVSNQNGVADQRSTIHVVAQTDASRSLTEVVNVPPGPVAAPKDLVVQGNALAFRVDLDPNVWVAALPGPSTATAAFTATAPSGVTAVAGGGGSFFASVRATADYAFDLVRIPANGGVASAIVTGRTVPAGHILADADGVYWWESDASGESVTVFRVAHDGSGLRTLATGLASQPISMRQNAGHLYLFESSAGGRRVIEVAK